MKSGWIAIIGGMLGLVGPLLALIDDSDVSIVLAVLALLVAGLVMQVRASILAWREDSNPFRAVLGVTSRYCAGVSVGTVVGATILFMASFSLPGLGFELAVLSLPAMWAVAAVCGVIAATVASVARALTAR